MCDYCKGGNDYRELFYKEYDFGMLGKAESTISICKGSNSAFLSMVVNGDLIGDDFIYEKLPINYCPRCGEKLL